MGRLAHVALYTMPTRVPCLSRHRARAGSEMTVDTLYPALFVGVPAILAAWCVVTVRRLVHAYADDPVNVPAAECLFAAFGLLASIVITTAAPDLLPAVTQRLLVLYAVTAGSALFAALALTSLVRQRVAPVAFAMIGTLFAILAGAQAVAVIQSTSA